MDRTIICLAAVTVPAAPTLRLAKPGWLNVNVVVNGVAVKVPHTTKLGSAAPMMQNPCPPLVAVKLWALDVVTVVTHAGQDARLMLEIETGV